MWQWVRICKVVALLAFFLPWITVSCSNQKIATASGFDLARGSINFINPVSRSPEAYHGNASLLLVLAVLAILAGLFFSLRSGSLRDNALVVMACSAVALILSAVATARIDSRSVGLAASRQQSGFDAGMANAMIRVDYAYGFWITILALAAAAFFAWQIFQAHGSGGSVAGSSGPVSNEPQPPS